MASTYKTQRLNSRLLPKVALTGLCAGLCLIASGCTSDPSVTPTHYWTSQESNSQSEYNRDNAQCGANADLQDDRSLLMDASFDSYRECMIERGYVLRTY